MKEYQTFSYIMYQESIEREKREEEERRRADEQKKAAEKERQQEQRPQTRAEILMQARRNANMINNVSTDEELVLNNSNDNIDSSSLGTSATLEDLVDYIEEEM